MNFYLCALSVLVAVAAAAPSPLDLGPGGVFKSADAQSYFAARFGSGFFANLASLQRGGAAAQRSRPVPAPAPRKERKRVVK